MCPPSRQWQGTFDCSLPRCTSKALSCCALQEGYCSATVAHHSTTLQPKGSHYIGGKKTLDFWPHPRYTGWGTVVGYSRLCEENGCVIVALHQTKMWFSLIKISWNVFELSGKNFLNFLESGHFLKNHIFYQTMLRDRWIREFSMVLSYLLPPLIYIQVWDMLLTLSA